MEVQIYPYLLEIGPFKVAFGLTGAQHISLMAVLVGAIWGSILWRRHRRQQERESGKMPGEGEDR